MLGILANLKTVGQSIIQFSLCCQHLYIFFVYSIAYILCEIMNIINILNCIHEGEVPCVHWLHMWM